jgi:hypothetical protein
MEHVRASTVKFLAYQSDFSRRYLNEHLSFECSAHSCLESWMRNTDCYAVSRLSNKPHMGFLVTCQTATESNSYDLGELWVSSTDCLLV